MSKESKCRKENYTTDELEILCQGVQKRSGIINGKFSGVLDNAKKQNAWNEIASEVSQISGICRTSSDVKRKWIKYKSELKLKVSGTDIVTQCILRDID